MSRKRSLLPPYDEFTNIVHVRRLSEPAHFGGVTFGPAHHPQRPDYEIVEVIGLDGWTGDPGEAPWVGTRVLMTWGLNLSTHEMRREGIRFDGQESAPWPALFAIREDGSPDRCEQVVGLAC